jgi:hypothetical protein
MKKLERLNSNLLSEIEGKRINALESIVGGTEKTTTKTEHHTVTRSGIVVTPDKQDWKLENGKWVKDGEEYKPIVIEDRNSIIELPMDITDFE